MKKNFRFLILFSLVILIFLSKSQLICGTECTLGLDRELINHQNVKIILQEHIGDNPTLLDSSIDRDIVVFLGNTGAGKSTLINYLSNKNLRFDDSENIVLENENDLSAAAIGNDNLNSKTLLPKLIQASDLLLYDFPGFQATKGSAYNLLNAYFLKHIIEKAKTVKLVCVVDVGQITTDKAKSFKEVYGKITQLIPNETIKNFSCLVCTKRNELRAKDISGYLNTRLGFDKPNGFDQHAGEHSSIIKFWMDNQMVAEMSKPREDMVNQIIDSSERHKILSVIRNTGLQNINSININVIFDIIDKNNIKEIYDTEIKDIIVEFNKQNLKDLGDFQRHTLSALGEEFLEKSKTYIISDYIKELKKSIEKSPLIKLLRHVSDDLYKLSWKDKKKIAITDSLSWVSCIDDTLSIFFSELLSSKMIEDEQQYSITTYNRLQDRDKIHVLRHWIDLAGQKYISLARAGNAVYSTLFFGPLPVIASVITGGTSSLLLLGGAVVAGGMVKLSHDSRTLGEYASILADMIVNTKEFALRLTDLERAKLHVISVQVANHHPFDVRLKNCLAKAVPQFTYTPGLF